MYDCSLPALSKTSIKNKKTTLGERGALTCQFCPLPPPPLLPPMVQAWSTYLFPRGDLGDAVAWGQNLPMPLHRAIFTSFFFSLQTRACGLTRASKKSHFRHVAPIVSPFRPSIPIIPPPHPLAPPPNVHPKACDACVAGGGLGGGQRRCEGAEERDMMATTTTTTTLPLLQTERTTSACAVEP